LDGHEVNNLGDEVFLEKIRFLLVEGNSLEIGNSRSNDCGTSWALKKTGPIRASTHNRNDEHMDIPSSTLMLITWVKGQARTKLYYVWKILSMEKEKKKR